MRSWMSKQQRALIFRSGSVLGEGASKVYSGGLPCRYKREGHLLADHIWKICSKAVALGIEVVMRAVCGQLIQALVLSKWGGALPILLPQKSFPAEQSSAAGNSNDHLLLTIQDVWHYCLRRLGLLATLSTSKACQRLADCIWNRGFPSSSPTPNQV